MPLLRTLNVSNTGVDGAGLVELSQLLALAMLDISDTSVTGDGLRLLHNLSTLRVLNVGTSGEISSEAQYLLREALPELLIAH